MFWNVGVWRDGAPVDFQLFGVPFILAALYMTVGRFALDAALRSRMAYFVTDRRVIMMRQGWARTTRSLDLDNLPGLEFNERGDGSGTITFGEPVSWLWRCDIAIWQPTLDRTPQLIRVADVRHVYALIARND